MKKFFQWSILLAFLSIILVIILYAFEAYLKFTDPFINDLPFDSNYFATNFRFYDNYIIPPETLLTWGRPINYNSDKMRERDFKEFSNTKNIIVLGDSLTFGVGLTEQERYSRILEDYLRKEFDDNYRVINLGISGGPTITERDVLTNYIDKLTPALVLIGFCFNDVQPKSQSYTPERQLFSDKYGGIITSISNIFVKAHLPLIGMLIQNAINDTVGLLGIIPSWEEGLDRVYKTDSNEWKMFTEALDDIYTMSNTKKLPPPIFAVLNSGDPSPEYKNTTKVDSSVVLIYKWYHQAEDAASKAGFTTLNFEKAIHEANMNSTEMRVNCLDGHPSKKLNQIYADNIYKVIKKYIEDGKL